MELPLDLRRSLEAELASMTPARLTRVAGTLSRRYRTNSVRPHSQSLVQTEDEVRAYAAFRMPATFAAVSAALAQIKVQRPSWTPRSLLDVGAGPGTAAWAALNTWPSIQEVTLLERDVHMVALGQRIVAGAQAQALRAARWKRHNLADIGNEEPADLVTAGYVLGELAEADLEPLLHRLWTSATDTLLVVEPGTPAGFSIVLRVRDAVLRSGGSVVAPCPHHFSCPLAGNDWCHFAQRIARSPLHRLVKGGTLSYEDEKYSYVALSRTPCVPFAARVIRHPQIRPGRIDLELCTPSGIERTIVSRKQGVLFRQARHLRWGSAIPVPTTPVGPNDPEQDVAE